MVDNLQLFVAIFALHISIVSCVFTILSFFIVKKINTQQILREEYQNLLAAIVKPYNFIETDIILLTQGDFDLSFSKECLDKRTLQLICETKSYSLVTDNQALFDYLDKLISGEKLSCDRGSAEDLGGLINDYFQKRSVLIGNETEEEIKEVGRHLRTLFLNKTRRLRNETIKRLKRICSNRKR